MKKPYRIAIIRLYIINCVRRIRIELDITGAELSRAVAPSGNSKFIGTIESSKNTSAYTEQTLNEVAIEFNRRAKELQAELNKDPDNTLKIKTNYTVHDFYPAEPFPDELVEKQIEPLPKGSGPAATLHFLLNTDPFFNEERTVREITDYCNQFRGTTWPPGHFTGLCFRLKTKGRLIRIDEGDKDIRYKNVIPVTS